ncbi:unnamed protein product [Arabis nemorensis]|uniref:Fungal lipase-type domain-containing protein n=1 Tax=Arabis nemorensis TaxID=586526 RepID=A0A565CUZ0_9BRAS|nr:unnamed protein product [Arabis nemorensis]
MEMDRQRKRVGAEAQAKRWWEDSHFTLLETLMEGSDSSIYGAIFEYNFSYNYQNFSSLRVPPRYVIAFRGTILTSQTWFSDARHDLRCIFDNLHHSPKFEHAMQAIHNMVVKYRDTSVWLAGHSLGAGLAVLAGKTMARFGFFLEAYIFNPPISSIPLETLIKCKMLKGGIRFGGSLLKAVVAKIFKVQEDDLPMNIVRWTPYLYVNPADPICLEYIGYFKNKTFISKIGLSEIERTATRNPLRSLLVGKKKTSSPSEFANEPLHFLTSAYMTVNKNVSHDIRKAHGLDQWRDPSFNGEYVFYQFNS